MPALPESDQGTGYFCFLSWLARCTSLWRLSSMNISSVSCMHCLRCICLFGFVLFFPNINLIDQQTAGFLPEHFLIVHSCLISPLCFLVSDYSLATRCTPSSHCPHLSDPTLLPASSSLSEQLLHVDRRVYIIMQKSKVKGKIWWQSQTIKNSVRTASSLILRSHMHMAAQAADNYMIKLFYSQTPSSLLGQDVILGVSQGCVLKEAVCSYRSQSVCSKGAWQLQEKQKDSLVVKGTDCPGQSDATWLWCGISVVQSKCLPPKFSRVVTLGILHFPGA